MSETNKTKINKVSEGRFMVAAASAGVSGDAAGAFSLPDGRLAFILSDGMGKGMKAAAESRAVMATMKKLLKEGITPSRAIKLVNKQLIKDRPYVEDMFATVDMTIIDKKKAVAHLYKMGAATSFLLRENVVKKIDRAALPVGMIGKISACQIKINLRPGDILIMVSDGITEADRGDLGATWLSDYLKQVSCNVGPRIMAGNIVAMAQERYGRREKDDLTAVVIQIK